jgi:hypothetical protein
MIDNRQEAERNALQMGRGDGRFAEAVFRAEGEASEWSWMPIFLDVDLDGFEKHLAPVRPCRL